MIAETIAPPLAIMPLRNAVRSPSVTPSSPAAGGVDWKAGAAVGPARTQTAAEALRNSLRMELPD